MKTKLALLALLLVVPAFAGGPFQDRFRIIKGEECDLGPLFAWYRGGPGFSNPMPAWHILNGKVLQTTKEGVLMDCSLYEKPIFIRGYPYRNPDGAHISVFAVKGRLYTYHDLDGIERNVIGFDYGKVKK